MTAEFTWQKSSYSSTGDNCVEVARRPGGVALRESEAPEIVLSASRGRLAALLERFKAGHLDSLAG